MALAALSLLAPIQRSESIVWKRPRPLVQFGAEMEAVVGRHVGGPSQRGGGSGDNRLDGRSQARPRAQEATRRISGGREVPGG